MIDLRIGILGVAHMHVWSYVHALSANPQVTLVGFVEMDAERSTNFAAKTGLKQMAVEALLGEVDAVIVCSTNAQHAEYAVAAAQAGKDILCEKPLATTLADADRMIEASRVAGKVLMTGFPCRFSEAFQRLKRHVSSGAIGRVLAINTTNRGTCPFDWFVDIAESGGGALIDHVVHVADLLKDLLGEEPLKVTAQVGNNMYGQSWEDTAMLTLEFPSGIFATLDSSWSRPKSFKTWGDVTLSVIGEKGMINVDLFGQALEAYGEDRPYHAASYGSDLDALMIAEFLIACREARVPSVTGEDGRAALRVALMGYESLATPAMAFAATGS